MADLSAIIGREHMRIVGTQSGSARM